MRTIGVWLPGTSPRGPSLQSTVLQESRGHLKMWSVCIHTNYTATACTLHIYMYMYVLWYVRLTEVSLVAFFWHSHVLFDYSAQGSVHRDGAGLQWASGDQLVNVSSAKLLEIAGILQHWQITRPWGPVEGMRCCTSDHVDSTHSLQLSTSALN